MGSNFIDNSEEVKRILERTIIAGLHEAAGELEAQTKRNTKVDTGQTKGSWQNRVDEAKQEAVVGSSFENAIWEEFGTGEYALNGDGRKGGWFYEDDAGVGHFTKGKHPKRPLHNAFSSKKNTCIKIIQSKLKELGE